MDEDIIETNIYDFKTNFSEYVRRVQTFPNAIIKVKKYNKAVGFFIACPEKQDEPSNLDQQ